MLRHCTVLKHQQRIAFTGVKLTTACDIKRRHSRCSIVIVSRMEAGRLLRLINAPIAASFDPTLWPTTTPSPTGARVGMKLRIAVRSRHSLVQSSTVAC